VDPVDEHGGRHLAGTARRVLENQVHGRRRDPTGELSHLLAVVVVRDHTRLPVTGEGVPARVIPGWAAAGSGRRTVEVVARRAAEPLHDVLLTIGRPALAVGPDGGPVRDLGTRRWQVDAGLK